MDALKNLFGALRFAGPDARTFLQGQLTNDMRLLAPGKPLLAALCNPQGRVIAILELHEDSQGIIAFLPASMAAPVIERLRKYLLRAKATITDASGELPQLSSLSEAASVTTATANEWRLKQIAAGRPQVYPETSEEFVAQMLNLDALGAISFDKGCYTGQEIVARAHYRGKVKRRMQRLRTQEPLDLAPGAEGRLADGRSFKVVHSATLPDGRGDFLAVMPLTATASAGEDAHTDAAPPAIQVEAMPLPYPLPE